MKTKICSTCKLEKPISEFHKQKDGKFGVRPDCKACLKKYQLENKIRIQKVSKEYRDKNKEKIRDDNKRNHLKNKEANNKRHKKYYQDNKEKEALRAKKYRLKHKKHLDELHTVYTRERRRNDPEFKLLCNLRNRIYDTVFKGHKSDSTTNLVGCAIEDLKKHLESQFTEAMTWKNHGKYGWHIDHIKPCISFDLSKPSEQRKCFYFSNLQPLWAIDNLKKGSKY